MNKQIPNYPNYEMTEIGDVFSKHSRHLGKIIKLKPYISKGYLRVRLFFNGKNKNEYVHRLVLTTFNRVPKKGEVCRHLDGNSLNNNISNLKWGSHQENVSDRDKIHKTGKLPDNSNENNGMCKLSDKQIQEIRDLYKTSKFTQKQVAKEYNVSQAHTSVIVNNKTRII